MFNQFFYHETIRKTVIVFGSLFSNVHIVRKNEMAEVIQNIKVPIAYAQKEKYVFRNQELPTLTNLTQVDLPRMSFEIASYLYDGRRKVNSTNYLRSVNGTPMKQYPPVPYNIGLKLHVYTKSQEDALIILEQILPMFTPEYNVTIDAVTEMQIRQDIPIQLDAVNIETIYTETHDDVRMIIHSLNFTAKVNLFGPVAPVGIIKIVDVGIATTVDKFNNNTFDGNYKASVFPLDANRDDPHTIIEEGNL